MCTVCVQQQTYTECLVWYDSHMTDGRAWLHLNISRGTQCRIKHSLSREKYKQMLTNWHGLGWSCMNSPLSTLIDCVWTIDLVLPWLCQAEWPKALQHCTPVARILTSSEHYKLKLNSCKGQLWHEVSQFHSLTSIQLQWYSSVYQKEAPQWWLWSTRIDNDPYYHNQHLSVTLTCLTWFWQESTKLDLEIIYKFN